MNEIQTYPMDAKCKHCGHAYGNHSHMALECPNYDNTSPVFLSDQFFTPVTAKDATYAESISKACDTIGFLVCEIKDAHASAPSVAAEMLLLGWLEQIVKIKTGLIRLKAETKGA